MHCQLCNSDNKLIPLKEEELSFSLSIDTEKLYYDFDCQVKYRIIIVI